MLKVSIHPKCPKHIRAALISGRLSIEDLVGIVTLMLDEDNPRSIREQLDLGYSHGGGWRPQPGWTFDEDDMAKYPGDRAQAPQLKIEILRKDNSYRATLLTYPYAYFRLDEPGVTDAPEMVRMD